MFEAIQERPVYWDNLPYHRSVTLSRGGDNRDWIQSWHRVTKNCTTIDAAIAYAKRVLAQRPGCPVEIRYTRAGGSRVTIVSRDSAWHHASVISDEKEPAPCKSTSPI